MSTFCHAPLKIALLLHKMANGPYSLSETVFAVYCVFHNPEEKLEELSWIYAMGCLKGHKKFGQSNNIIIDALVISLLLGNTVWSVSSNS